MKKLEEKNNLIKVTGLMVLITVLLTWVIPQGMYQGSTVNVTEITRVGIFDFFTYGLLGVYYFTVLVTFLFVLGAFYQVLSRCKGYQALTDGLAKFFKGKEIVFALVVSFIIAAISAVTNEYIVVISIIPFIITIANKMKMDKISAFVITFGSLLIGILGSVYSTKIVGMNTQYFGIKIDELLWPRLVYFFASYVFFNLFTVLHIRKEKKSKKNEVVGDLFESKETNAKSKSKAWSIGIIFGLFAIITLLAYFPWANVLKAEWPVNALESIKNFKVFDSTIFAYIFGGVQAFGQWDIFGVQVTMLVAILVIKIVDRMSLDELLEAFGEGFKKVSKLAIILLLCYMVLEFAVMYPVLPTIVDWFMGLFKGASTKVSLLLSTIPSTFTSLFTVEYQYTLNLIHKAFTTTYESQLNAVGFMTQSTFGLASLFSPASAMLLVGLSYLGISYKEWMKYIWKFLIIMFAVLLIILVIIAK